MVTVSSAVKGIVSGQPLLQEGLRQGIMSFAALAERIKGKVEEQLGKSVNEAAIIMALRRHGESLEKSDVKRIRINPDMQLTLKTNLAYFSVKRTRELFRKLEALYKAPDYESGGTLNIINGNHEVSIITDEKNSRKVSLALAGEHVTTTEKSLVSISMSLEKDFVYTPGVIFAVTRKLYWDNINIFELVTTATELTFIFQKKDAMKAYASIQELAEAGR